MEFKKHALTIALLLCPFVTQAKFCENSPVLTGSENLKTYLKKNGYFYDLNPTKGATSNEVSFVCSGNDGLKKKAIVKHAEELKTPAPTGVIGYLWAAIFGETKQEPQYQVQRTFEKKTFLFIPYQQNLKVKIVNQGFDTPGTIEEKNTEEKTTK